MYVSDQSFGGGTLSWSLLLENDINPKKDFAAILPAGTQDKVVLAVLKGEADAGTVRTDILEKMNDEGRIRIDDLKVIHPQKDNFPLLHSTKLYPEWAFIACQPADKKLQHSLTKVLMLLDADHEAMKAAEVFKWNRPGKYDAVAECLRRVENAN